MIDAALCTAEHRYLLQCLTLADVAVICPFHVRRPKQCFSIDSHCRCLFLNLSHWGYRALAVLSFANKPNSLTSQTGLFEPRRRQSLVWGLSNSSNNPWQTGLATRYPVFNMRIQQKNPQRGPRRDIVCLTSRAISKWCYHRSAIEDQLLIPMRDIVCLKSRLVFKWSCPHWPAQKTDIVDPERCGRFHPRGSLNTVLSLALAWRITIVTTEGLESSYERADTPTCCCYYSLAEK